MLLALNLPFVKAFVYLLKIPPPILYAGVLMFTVLGAWASDFSSFSLLVLLAMALLGYFMEANGFPLAPAILAVALVPLLEDNLRRALAISDGNYLVFIQRPVSGGILAVVVLVLLIGGGRSVMRRRASSRSSEPSAVA